jgi:hypothetical protein
MRHIFHTCLLALRLISSVDLENARTRCVTLFESALLNNALSWMYSDNTKEKKKNRKVIYLTADHFSASA